MARKLRISLAIMEEMLEWDVTLQSGEKVLSRDTVPGFIEDDGHKLV